jgi:hypothetical protein
VGGVEHQHVPRIGQDQALKRDAVVQHKVLRKVESIQLWAYLSSSGRMPCIGVGGYLLSSSRT